MRGAGLYRAGKGRAVSYTITRQFTCDDGTVLYRKVGTSKHPQRAIARANGDLAEFPGGPVTVIGPGMHHTGTLKRNILTWRDELNGTKKAFDITRTANPWKRG